MTIESSDDEAPRTQTKKGQKVEEADIMIATDEVKGAFQLQSSGEESDEDNFTTRNEDGSHANKWNFGSQLRVDNKKDD
jgi:hypothetical protein